MQSKTHSQIYLYHRRVQPLTPHKYGKKRRPSFGANQMKVIRKIPGIVLLSHSQIYSTIAAGALNYRVREGNVCVCSAMDTGKK